MPPNEELPPELRDVSKDEWRELYVAAMRLALGLTKSKARAEQLVSDTFDALLTTRRWDPAKGPLLRHVLGSLTSIRSNQFKSKAAERSAKSDKAFQREEIGVVGLSPEDRMLSHSASEETQSNAEAELDELERSVAHHPVATRVLRCMRAASQDDERKKPAEIAAELGLPKEQVYMATKMLREHLGKLRAKRGPGGGEET